MAFFKSTSNQLKNCRTEKVEILEENVIVIFESIETWHTRSGEKERNVRKY